MRVPGLKTAVKTVRLLRSQFVRRAVILGYHRVAEIAHDPYHLCASPALFDTQLRLLSEIAHPLRLSDLVASLRHNQIPENGIAITFDDGYADVLYSALPLLEKYRIPATIFITTGRLGQEFWWDELDRIIFEAEKIPEKLLLSINLHEYKLRIGSSSAQAGLNERYRLLKTLHQWMQSFSEQEREEVLWQLKECFEVKSGIPSRNRALTSDEVVTLSQHDLIEVGSHSVSHTSLPLMSTEMQKQEAVESKCMLENLLEKPVNAFSYPAGMYSQGLKMMLYSAGFKCACVSANDIVWAGSDPFALPRFWLQDYNRDRLTRWLRTWLVRA